MPKHPYHVSLKGWAEVHELPGSWPLEELCKVIALADYDDPVVPEEAADIAVMLLQDLSIRPATQLVLQVVFGEEMAPGIRQNIVDDLQEDRPWEDHTRISQQSGLFEAVVLLQRAFPTRFGNPDAARLSIEVTTNDPAAGEKLEAPSPSLLLLRLLAAGMSENAVLNRLYGEEMADDHFDQADSVLWRVEGAPSVRSASATSRIFDIHTSLHWVAPLEDVSEWSGRG
ncbi:MAG: hypothetical protein O2780_14310 [Proteobacteria bacterium]|jgi:hypothetical protein|nr:hypothetical protein [Pseudomonadota bacterium]MDA1300775.1 hypothetical protein [Pseudomonadota bacterium]